MPIELLEPYLDATLQSLRAGLPDAVAAVNARWTDEPQIVTPADDAYYPGGWTILKYPCVEVAMADFTLGNLSLNEADGDLLTPLIVRGWVSDAKADPGRLYRRALRFGTAILRVLIEPDAFGGNAQLGEGTVVRGALRFNPEDDTRDEVEAAVLLVFQLSAVEVR